MVDVTWPPVAGAAPTPDVTWPPTPGVPILVHDVVWPPGSQVAAFMVDDQGNFILDDQGNRMIAT